MLSLSKNIVVVAPDLGLRQSMTFALEVEGYTVNAFSSWCKSEAPHIPSDCLIIDDQIVRACQDAMTYVIDATENVILLTDGMSPPLDGVPGHALAKPFDGADLLRLVKSAALAA